MSLSEFRATFFEKYRDHSYETQQKAYLFFWASVWAFIPGFLMMAYAIHAYYAKGDIVAFKFIFANLFGLSIIAICCFFTLHEQFQKASFLALFVFAFNFSLAFIISLSRFYETGIFTNRELFYGVLAFTAIFHYRKVFLIVTAAIILLTSLVPALTMPNFGPQKNLYVNVTLLNGTLSFIIVSVFLYFTSLINQKSLDTAEKEITINKALNADLDQKVKDRTKELKDKNIVLANIENNLKRYLPVQLVSAIKSGRKDAIPETERRKLTVFFSDIKGFTEVTESLEAEELSTLLNEYLTEMTLIAHNWGGTVDKFIGDAIMIFFGAPERTPDKENALNCVKMAIEMQNKMKELQDKWYNGGFENPLHIRVGISTGTSTVGNFGAKDRLSYTVIGGQVNIAARLEGLCKPDSIMISHPTWALVKDEIDCAPGEKVSVKGIQRKIMTYEVVPN